MKKITLIMFVFLPILVVGAIVFGTTSARAQNLCGTPDIKQTGVCILPGQVCQANASGDYSCFTPGSGGPTGPTQLIHRTFTITPTTATVAVGSSVQFRVNEYENGTFIKEVTLDPDTSPYENSFFADPFYLKKGDLPGSFVGVNPGTTNVVYKNNLVTVSASVTVTGFAAPTSGKIQITLSKDVFGQMFPQPSDCDAQFGYHCTWGFTDPQTFKVNASFDPPAFETAWIRWQNHFPAKGNDTGPRILSLADPLNPVLYPDISQGINISINTDTDWEGDFGPYLGAQDVVYSKDGTYQVMKDSYRRNNVWHDGVKRRLQEADSARDLVGIIDRGYKTFLITDSGSFDISDIETMPTHTAGPLLLPTISPILPNLPSTFPRMTIGKKFILSDENYVASIEGTSLTWYATVYNTPPPSPRIRIYNLGQTSPVATLDISADVASGVPTKIFQQKRDATTDYIVMLVGPKWAYGQPYSNNYLPQSIYVYKFNTQTKQLTKAVSGLKLKEGMVIGATGFNLGDQRGIIALTSLGKDYTTYGTGPNALSFPTNYEYQARAYLYTDLADGKVEDVLANSPVTSGKKLLGGPMASLVSGNSTYVYIGKGSVGPEDGPLYVWKLDIKGSSSGGGGGGGSFCPTGQSKPHYEVGSVSTSSCVSIATCGVNQCSPSTGGGGGGGGGGTLTGCDFILTPTPETLTVKSNSSFAVYGLGAADNVDRTCTISVTSPTIKDSAGNRIIYPSSPTAALLTPGTQTAIYFNLSTPPVGSYDLDLKATAKGVSAKTVNLKLIVQ